MAALKTPAMNSEVLRMSQTTTLRASSLAELLAMGRKGRSDVGLGPAGRIDGSRAPLEAFFTSIISNIFGLFGLLCGRILVDSQFGQAASEDFETQVVFVA